MTERKIMALAKHAASVAKQSGASDARVAATSSREVSVEWRDGKLDRIQESTQQSLAITLYVDGRYSVNDTSDLRKDAVEAYIQNAVAATRYLARDEHRHLPDPARYENATKDNLEIYDPEISKISPEERLRAAEAMESAAREGTGSDRIISVTTSVSDYGYHSVLVATNGLEASEEGTSTWRSATVSIRDADDRKPRGSDYGGGTFAADLPDVAIVGNNALRRALDQTGSRQVDTGRYEVIVENRAAPTLSRHLLSPLSGASLQQRRSFLENKLGQTVASAELTLTSDPHLKRGLSSTAWDGEGMATLPRVVFDKGVLKTYFLDTYYASKLGEPPTTGSPANLVWDGGERSAAEMIEKMKKGIFITSFLGGNSNATTGDFSLGIRGFYVEKGKILHPVSEMNMAGNHLELWKHLVEVGNDPWSYSSNRSPSLRFKEVQCSGAKG
jgi:PmbA protein